MIRMTLSFTSTVFFSGTLMSTALVMSATSWYMIWTGLECNLFSFIPLMIFNKLHQEKEATLKYLFAQGVPSGFLLLTIMNNNENMVNSSSMMMLLLATKLGMAPMHFWFPSVMNASSWLTCWMLCTTQKIGPFILMSQSLSPSPMIVYILIISSSFTSGIGGLNQTLLRPLLAYSSIGHMSWAIGVSTIEKEIAMAYFMTYSIIVSTAIIFFNQLQTSRNNQIAPMMTPYFLNWCVFLSLGSMSGLPPLLGFFPKMMVLMSLGENNMIFMGSILILGSLMNMYYYLKIMFSSIINTPPSYFYPSNKRLYLFIYFAIFISISSTSFSLVMLIFLIW